MVDLRQEPSLSFGAHFYDGPDAVTRWHQHGLHEIEYSIRGIAEIESAASHHLLPPLQAAWIPAGVTHRTTLRRVQTMSVFFAPPLMAGFQDRVRIIAVTPLVKEMLLHAAQWPIDRSADTRPSADFAGALAQLVAEALEHELPLGLPTSSDPLVAEIMEFTRMHLVDLHLAELARRFALSERTLHRRFTASCGMTWSDYLATARLLRAVALLTEPDMSVLQVCHAVGFTSFSAFSRAFKRRLGETPSAYRARVNAPSRPSPARSPA